MTGLAPDVTPTFYRPQNTYRELDGTQLAGGMDAWVQVLLWGAGGSLPAYGSSRTGAHGAFISGALRVRGSETLRIIVGSYNYNTDAGCGGRSAIQRYNPATLQYEDIVTAGAGGVSLERSIYSTCSTPCGNSANAPCGCGAVECFPEDATALACAVGNASVVWAGSGPSLGGCSASYGAACTRGSINHCGGGDPSSRGGGGGGSCGGVQSLPDACGAYGMGGGNSNPGPLVCVQVADWAMGNLTRTPFRAGDGAAMPGADGLVAVYALPPTWAPCEQVAGPVTQPLSAFTSASTSPTAIPSISTSFSASASPTMFGFALAIGNAPVTAFPPQGGYRELRGAQLAGGRDAWIQVLLWGAGGAQSVVYGYAGAHGAFVSGALRVRGNETLRLLTGAARGNINNDAGCGGRSAIQRFNPATSQYEDIVTAGAGGVSLASWPYWNFCSPCTPAVDIPCGCGAVECFPEDATALPCATGNASTGKPAVWAGSGSALGGCSASAGAACATGSADHCGGGGRGGGGGGFCGGARGQDSCGNVGIGGGSSNPGPLVCVQLADKAMGNLSRTPFSAGNGAGMPGADGLIVVIILPESWQPCNVVELIPSQSATVGATPTPTPSAGAPASATASATAAPATASPQPTSASATAMASAQPLPVGGSVYLRLGDTGGALWLAPALGCNATFYLTGGGGGGGGTGVGGGGAKFSATVFVTGTVVAYSATAGGAGSGSSGAGGGGAAAVALADGTVVAVAGGGGGGGWRAKAASASAAHTRTVLSALPVASCAPEADHASAVILRLWPSTARGWPSRRRASRSSCASEMGCIASWLVDGDSTDG